MLSGRIMQKPCRFNWFCSLTSCCHCTYCSAREWEYTDLEIALKSVSYLLSICCICCRKWKLLVTLQKFAWHHITEEWCVEHFDVQTCFLKLDNPVQLKIGSLSFRLRSRKGTNFVENEDLRWLLASLSWGNYMRGEFIADQGSSTSVIVTIYQKLRKGVVKKQDFWISLTLVMICTLFHWKKMCCWTWYTITLDESKDDSSKQYVGFNVSTDK